MPPKKPKPSKHTRQRAMTRGAIATEADTSDRREVLIERGGGYVIARKLRTLTMVAILLRERGGLTVEQLRAQLDVSRATLYRMRDDVIAAGLQLVITERDGVSVWSLSV